MEKKLPEPLWKIIWRVLKKLKIELFYDFEISLLCVYPKATQIGSQRGICIHMSISSITYIAKMWKQPKSPLTGRWIKKLSLTRTEEYYSVTRKKRNSDICNYMDKP